jgi:hypothetical protein
MSSKEKYFTLEEIRNAQAEIVTEMDRNDLSRSDRLKLEQASLNLRNIERVLVKSTEKELVASLKKETLSLTELTKDIRLTSEKLFRIGGTLQKIIKITGRIIDILDLVK